MDAKSLAKSKRAHSQHHQTRRKPHPIPQPTTSPSSFPAHPNPSKQQHPRQKSHVVSSSLSGLPSNWDRYEDDEESQDVVPSDVVVPKSKGADFAYLVSEAQAQLDTRVGSGNAPGFASFDDVLPDFNQGVSALLSVRGEGILSWSRDDNFAVNDKSTTGYEASFLSIDLHSLAAQLERLDVSKRLFIEEDILHPELDADGLEQTITSESEQARIGADEMAEVSVVIPGSFSMEKILDNNSKRRPSTSLDSYSHQPTYPHLDAEVVDQGSEPAPCTNIASDSAVPIFQYQVTKVIDKRKDDFRQQQTGAKDVHSVSFVDSKEKETSAFEAMASETELDMLLNSFEQTNIVASSGISKKSTDNLRAAQRNNSTFPEKLPSVYASKPPAQSTNVPINVVSIDDTIDDLLEETSVLLKNKINLHHPQEAVVTSHVPASSSQSKTTVLDDFDSWLDTI